MVQHVTGVAMIINAVGCPYSGLDILSMLVRNFGIRSRDNDYGINYDRRIVYSRIPYDCSQVPEWVIKWIDENERQGLNDYIKIDEHFLHNSWIRSCLMYELSQKYKDLNFIIMLRNPKYVIQDWYTTIGTTGPEVTINNYRKTVLRLFHFIWEQFDLMEKKPVVMEYKKFVYGEYTKDIFDMFKISHDIENYHKAQDILNKNKLKSYGEYHGDISNIMFFYNKLIGK